jgi:hypothetical protein
MKRAGAKALVALALACFGASVAAHGPTRQKVVEEIAIDAAPQAVWDRIRNFDAIQRWHPAVKSSPATDGNTAGSQRTLTLEGGGTVLEELEGYNDAERKYNYRMKDPGPIPVSNYTSTIEVRPGAGDKGSLVVWRGAFYRGYPNNDPPPDRNDEAAIKAVSDMYKAGLANLKKQAEAK